MDALDRHALVTAIWLPAGMVAVMLLHHGGATCILAGFGAILVGFIGHLIANAFCGTGFTVRERALGLALYVAALVGFGLATLASARFAARAFLPGAGGFLLLFAAVVFAMLTERGTRGAFESFDIVRSFRAGPR